MNGEPVWLEFARRFIGRKELPGPQSNDWIASLWYKLKAGWVWVAGGSDDSSVAWCGLFCAACLNETGHSIPQSFYRARSWLDWGTPLDFPVVGAIVVFERKGGGHVGFIVGKDKNDNLMVLGGNQSDSVSIAHFPKSRVLGYRWPSGQVLAIATLPDLDSDGKLSQNEA